MNNNLYLWKYQDSKFYGEISGVFLASEEEIKNILNLEIFLGEIHGKHSEVFTELDRDNFLKYELSKATIKELLTIFPNKYISGVDILGIATDTLAELSYQEEQNDISNSRYET